MSTPEIRLRLERCIKDEAPCEATGLMAIALALFELAESLSKNRDRGDKVNA
jgi:hypothetical protein